MMGGMGAWALMIPPLVFMAAVGACVGSFLNVVAYRMPRGEGLFRPGSRCPSCETPLTWRENFPILGWLWLGGKCRFCRSKIAPEYPLVEAACALLFVGVWAAWYTHSATGVTAPSDAAPEWTRAGLGATWPMFVLILALIASLVGMTLIDAKTFTIPPELPWIVTALALVTHPLLAAWTGRNGGRLAPFVAEGWVWTIPTPQSPAALAAALLTGAGLVISLGLVRLGLIRRSFDDFAEWEASRAQAGAAKVDSVAPADAPPLRLVLLRALAFTGPAIAGMAVGLAIGMRRGSPMAGMGVGLAVGLLAGTLLRSQVRDGRTSESAPAPKDRPEPGVSPTRAQRPQGVRPLVCLAAGAAGGVVGSLLHIGIGAAGAGLGVLVGVVAGSRPAAADPSPTGEGGHDLHWLDYPHSRREMWRELAFLLPAMTLGAVGWWIGGGGPSALREALAAPPLWLSALGGSLLGYLAAGGLVWGVRILATLAVGREAMGMGDVHLLAAAGAVLGWIDPVLAFFLAPAFGLGYAVWSAVGRRGVATALPYGPHLALAVVGVVLWKPWVESALSALLSRPIALP